MDELALPEASYNDLKLLKLAREIAMDMRELDDILKSHSVTRSEWQKISTNTKFLDYLRKSTEEWQSATNTAERVRIKSLAFVEEALPEFFARAHDNRENLSAKTEVLKAVSRFAGIGVSGTEAGITGERFSVTINLGEDKNVKIERDVTPKVIEGYNDG